MASTYKQALVARYGEYLQASPGCPLWRVLTSKPWLPVMASTYKQALVALKRIKYSPPVMASTYKQALVARYG